MSIYIIKQPSLTDPFVITMIPLNIKIMYMFHTLYPCRGANLMKVHLL